MSRADLDVIASPSVSLFWLGLAAITLFRLWLSAIVPLTEDEAYYQLLAAHLQFGYYDHLPMIAWWIWAGEKVAGSTALGVRIAAVIASSLATVSLVQLGREFGASESTAQRAGLWLQATLLLTLSGFLASPENPTMLFWLLALLGGLRAVGRGSVSWWIGTGLAAGLAALSNYSGLLLLPGFILWLGLNPTLHRHLRSPGLWLAAFIALAVFGTNVVWNAQHDWIAFHKEYDRVFRFEFHPFRMLGFPVAQAVLLNPIVAGFAVAALMRINLPQSQERAPGISLVIWTTIPLAGCLLLYSLVGSVRAQWSMPLFPGLALLAVIESAAWGRNKMAHAATISVGPVAVGMAIVALVYFLYPGASAPGDPFVVVRGWPEFAARIDRLADVEGATWVGTASYGVKARLASEVGLGRPTVHVFERGRYPPSDNSWRADTHGTGLIVDLKRRLREDDYRSCFRSITRLSDISRGARQDGEGGVAYGVLRVVGPTKNLLRDGC